MNEQEQEAMAEYNLYDAPTTFILRFIREERETQINEPVGADNMVIALIRDKDYFGFSTEFIKSGTTLGFDVEAGRDEIKQEWEAQGVDAEVEFRMEQNGVALFKGLLKFATYSDDGSVINIEIERTNFEELFRTRFDTPTDLQATLSIDGVTLSGISSKNITLHSKRITKSAICDLEGVTDIEKQAECEAFGVFVNTLRLLTYNIRYDEFDEEVMKTTNWLLDEYNYIYHYNNFEYQFKTNEAGIYNISLQCKFDLIIDAPQASRIGALRVTLYIFADVPDSSGVQVGNRQMLANVEIYNGYISENKKELKNLSANHTVEVTLTTEQRVYAFIEIAFNSDGAAGSFIRTEATLKSSLFSVTGLTEAPASSCEVLDLVEAFEQNLRIATNTGGRVLKSDFLDSIRGKYTVSNGFRVRQFADDFKQITGTLKDFMETLNAIWALGYSFIEEKGVSMLRVEPVMRFFNSDYCVYECEAVFDYTEATAKDLLLNEFETGYEKYADNDLHTLLEFNTYRQYLLPFKHFKGKVTKKTKFITSGYMIEMLRRIQFASKPKDSDSNDDSIFLFTMSDINPLECERDEAFSLVSGEDDISSIYNARVSPARMALNWAPFLSAVCYHKSTAEQVKCQFYKQNGEFTTQLKTEPFMIAENQNFTVSRNKKFIPAIAEFKTSMFAKDYLRIRDSLLSRLGDGENNGYIQFFDRAGTVKTGWVMEMEYDAYRELASLKLLLRNADYVEQPAYDDEDTPQPDARYDWELDFSELEEAEQLNKADYGEEFKVTGWSPTDPSTLPQPTPPPTFSDYKNGIKKDNAVYTVTFTGETTGTVVLNTINVWWKAVRVKL